MDYSFDMQGLAGALVETADTAPPSSSSGPWPLPPPLPMMSRAAAALSDMPWSMRRALQRPLHPHPDRVVPVVLLLVAPRSPSPASPVYPPPPPPPRQRSQSLCSSEDSNTGVIVDTSTSSLPSFGVRTARAKEMLSAAPGGPVWGFCPKQKQGEEDRPYAHGLSGLKNFCSFCKKNGERFKTYQSHTLKSLVNGKEIVTCPILRNVWCEVCHATGDSAHTRSHCPKAPKAERRKVAHIVKNTRRRCDGHVHPILSGGKL